MTSKKDKISFYDWCLENVTDDLAKKPKKVHLKNWSEDPYSGGCYFCVPPIGSLAKNLHYFTKPFGNIYFAGTEAASHWMGYMEGALESAERVVQQINGVIDYDKKT